MIKEKVFKCLIGDFKIDSLILELAEEIKNGYTIFCIEQPALSISPYERLKEPNLIITLIKKETNENKINY